MNIHFCSGNSKEVENVSTRVKKTKEEIEQLKNELEKLINLGTQSTKTVEKVKPISSRYIDVHSYDPHSKKHAYTKLKTVEHLKPEPVSRAKKKPVKISPAKKEPVKISPAKKVRSYNVAEARDFIRKQKEKRAEQLKTQINVADNQLDLKKQKLKELHIKTIELVNKNVELKRERSKSREREAPIRLDKSKPVLRPDTNIKRQPQLPSKFQDRLKSQDRLQVVEKPDSKARSKFQECGQLEPAVNERVSRSRSRIKSTYITPAQKQNPHYFYPPHVKLNVSNENIELEKDRVVDSQNNGDAPVDLNKRLVDQSSHLKNDKGEKMTQTKNKQVLEHAIMTDACLGDSKETQTNRQNNFEGVAWIQPPPALPYPYNFINTVKRKLQYAINSPRTAADVGVQNSRDKSNETPSVDKLKSKEEIKELLLKNTHSDLRSFASHKCPNLDLKTVENLELITNNHSPKKDMMSRNLFTEYCSESDTSKNIPEISSESVESTNSKPQLSLEKLKKLKLQKSVKAALHSGVKPYTNGYPDLEHDSYSSDFQKESMKSVSSGKSGSTIKTVISEKKMSDSTSSSNDCSMTTKHSISSINKILAEHLSPQPDFQNVNNFFKKCLRGDGDSQRSFKSLLTDTQTSSSVSGSDPASFTSNESRKSLIFKKDNASSELAKFVPNTITLRTAIENLNIKNTGSGDDSQRTFKSLLTGDKILKSHVDSISENINEIVSSKSISTGKVGDSLKEPTVSLIGQGERQDGMIKSQMKNITLRPATTANNNVNEIHLKFEAEVRLLNDFNESFKQFMAVEKAYENLKSKNETNLAMTKMLHDVDTQTSIVTKTSTNITTEKSAKDTINSSINFSRGSEVIDELNDSANNNRYSSKSLQNSSLSDWNLSNLNESTNTNISTGEEEKSKFFVSTIENCNVKNYASIVSLNLFDQLIKEEDIRIQQLKAIIKIREQALLDRTKGELVWLAIQRKQLIQTGKIEEASLLKKKQRGILLKHEQERNEIKKLKQMQKEASEHRKKTLKQQRNLIKTQLSTDNMLSKITVKKRKERRSMGPLRVVQSCSESLHSETSISLKSSGIEDVLSITSKSVRVSEESELEISKGLKEEEMPATIARRTLLMREAALQKRRKAAEELLRWHQKLLDEERKISELEAAATSVVKQTPEERNHKYKFKGKQLNLLWNNITGCDEQKYVEDQVYVMSQMALEWLCTSATQYSNKNKKTKNSEQSNENSGISEFERSIEKLSEDVNYSSVFEPESVQEIINSQEEKTKISSISELIDNFSKIEDEISTLSKKSEDIVSLKKEAKSSHLPLDMTLNPITVPEEVFPEEEFDETVPNEESHISSVKKKRNNSTEVLVVEELGSKVEEVVSKSESIAQEDVKESNAETISDEEKLKISTDRSISGHKVESLEDAVTIEDEATSYHEQSSVQELILLFDDQKSRNSEHIEDYADNIKSLEVISSIENGEGTVISEQLKTQTPSPLQIKDHQSLKDKEPTDSIQTEHTDKSIGEIEVAESIATSAIEGNFIKSKTVDDQEQLKKKIYLLEETREISTVYREKENSPTILKDTGKDVLSLEEALESAYKIEESLTQFNEKLSGEVSEDVSAGEEEPLSMTTCKSETSSSINTEVDEKVSQKKTSNQIDVKKRVSEILADISPCRGDKSPRLQDLYVTAYDVGALSSTDLNENFGEGRQLPTDIFGSEAEELWKKQLAIEQEIKQIELQQKEQLPYMFMREIPNKPPPPYTPPSSLSSLPQSVLPTDLKEINEVASYSSKVLYKAYQNNNLDKVKFSENGFKLFSKIEVTKMCAEYIFNICKDMTRDHYRQFEKIESPSWLSLSKKPQLTRMRPSDAITLEKILSQKLKELFGFKKSEVVESAIIKWGRKKRDHVDEVLVIESQEEESQWTTFDKDELIVKNQVTDDIMKMLLEETSSMFAKILSKSKSVVG